ncbi:MAG TPA: 6-bladed beta-propeller [Gemmatimonadaceae bacterium]|nr:6-bladed beta-propeller [Gemmatimonadaceae bacterium]
MLNRLALSAALSAMVASSPLAQTPTPRWTLVPELRVGGDAVSGPEYEFTTIREIAVAPNGAMYVIQAQEQEIRVYDAQGKYVRTIGRQGGGPGEFTGLGSIGFIADTLYAIDFRQRRLTLFRADGALISTIVAEPAPPAAGRDAVYFQPSPQALLPEGSVLGGASYPSRLVASGQITRTPVFRMSRSAAVLDTVVWVPIGSGQGSVQTQNVALFFSQPISDEPLSVFAGPAARVYVIERAARSGTTAFRVTAVSARGDTLWSRSYPYRPVPLESGVADSIVNELVRRLSGGRRSGAPVIPPDDIRKAVFLPDHQVTITRVFAAADGALWLRREGFGDVLHWTVIGPDGNVAGTLALPRNVRPMTVVGDRAWGVELDDVDVPLLVRYRIRK